MTHVESTAPTSSLTTYLKRGRMRSERANKAKIKRIDRNGARCIYMYMSVIYIMERDGARAHMSGVRYTPCFSHCTISCS